MPEFIVRCPNTGCGASYRLDESLRGKTGRCTKCGQKFALASPEPGGPSADDVPAVWKPGDVILGLYEVKGVLGEGGMGTVYRVHHRELNRDLAVKTPRPEMLARPGAAENFEREAETWVNLGLHPHIVACFYVRRLGGIPRVFAECVEGGSLHDWVRNGKLYRGDHNDVLRRIVQVARDFARGLQHAHDQGLVHQDVKPANVLLTPEGLAKVTDFGLARARAVAGGTRHGAAGRSILVSAGGMTPAYCSPEQAQGRPLSSATDVWSWGVSILELFTGGVTWPSGTVAPEALEESLSAGPPQDCIPPCPPEVADLLRACLQRDPERRPKALTEVVAALDAYEKQRRNDPEGSWDEIDLGDIGGEVAEPAPEGPEREEESVALPPRLPFDEFEETVIGVNPTTEEPAGPIQAPADTLNNQAASLLDLGRTDAAAEKWTQALRADDRHPEATYNLGLLEWRAGRLGTEALLNRLRAVAASLAGQWLPIYLLARVYLERGDPAAAVQALDQLPQEARGDQVRSLLAQARECLPHAPRLARTLQTRRGPVLAVCLSADGKVALVAGSDPLCHLWDVATGRSLRVIDTGQEFGGVPLHGRVRTPAALTPDGRVALLTHPARPAVQLWDLEAGGSREFTPAPEAALEVVALSPDGSRLAAAHSGGPELHIWDVSDGRRVTVTGQPAGVTCLTFTPDGRRILAGGMDGTVRLHDAQTGACLNTFSGPAAPAWGVCVSGDGRHAAAVDARGAVWVWPLEGREALGRYHPHEGRVHAISLSNDGKLALSGGQDRLVMLWEVPSGRVIRTFAGHTHEVLCVALGADGRLAVSGGRDGAVHVWEVGRTVRAPVMLSGMLTAEAARDADRRYQQEATTARQEVWDKQWGRAVARLRAARLRPGCGSRPEALAVWELLYLRQRRGEFRGGWQAGSLAGTGAAVTSLAWMADGDRILSADAAGTLHLRDAAGGQTLAKFSGIAVTSARLAADETWFLAAEKDGTVGRWDARTRECRWARHAHTGPVAAVAVMADGRHALSGGPDGTMKLWDAPSGEVLRSWQGHDRVEALCLLPGEQRLLSAGGDRARLWDLATGRCVREWEAPGGAMTLDVSGDGRVAVAASARGQVVAWNPADTAAPRTLSEGSSSLGPAPRGRWVSVSLDGRHALSADGARREVCLWDVASGRCLHRLAGHQAPVTAVCLRPDGGRAASAAEDGTVKVWFLDWELEPRGPADWDEGARPYLEAFLTLHTPPLAAGWQFWLPGEEKVRRALTRQGRPRWDAADVEGLLRTLGQVGLGWLRPEGVRRELEKMAAGWVNRISEG